MAILSPNVKTLRSFNVIFLINMVNVQNMKSIVPELLSADNLLIQMATFSGAAKNENKRPKTIKSGAPGGCPTSNLYAAVMYSPQSHKLTVSSIVKKYTIVAIRKTSQPM